MNLSKPYYPSLDALRGIATLLVLIYHYSSLMPIGWAGVDLFFVLSGFLITGTLLQTVGHSRYFTKFFIRRVLRIFPVYFLMLFIFYLFSPILFSQKQTGSAYHYYNQYQSYFWTFTVNWLVVKHGPAPAIHLQHFWSLAVEQQYYSVWPFLIYFVRSHQLLKVTFISLIIIALVFRIFIWYHPTGYEAFYFVPLARMDSLCAGSLLAVLIYQKTYLPDWLILFATLSVGLLVLFALVSKNLSHNNPLFATVGYTILAIFYMCVVQKMSIGNSAIGHNKVLKRIGQISYGVYVYHLPIFALTSYLLGKVTSTVNSNLAAPTLALGTTLLASYLSYKFIELPILRLKHILS